MNIVMITNGSRPALLNQSLDSLGQNATSPLHTVTLVADGRMPGLDRYHPDTLIVNRQSVGASRSRNIGASSIPKYQRDSHVMFLDDDVYMCNGWDEAMMGVAHHSIAPIISGHAHPFNGSQPLQLGDCQARSPLVISSVCMMMPWSRWDEIGYFTEPGGPGGSEDYDYCMRAKSLGYGFAVTEPECVIHTGMFSSSGKPIIGYNEVAAHNEELIKLYGIDGVVFG